MKYHREPISEIPVYYSQLSFLSEQGEKMGADIITVPNGYQIAVWNAKSATNFILYAERTKKPRIFKTADSALKVCRDLGLTGATIRL